MLSTYKISCTSSKVFNYIPEFPVINPSIAIKMLQQHFSKYLQNKQFWRLCMIKRRAGILIFLVKKFVLFFMFFRPCIIV